MGVVSHSRRLDEVEVSALASRVVCGRGSEMWSHEKMLVRAELWSMANLVATFSCVDGCKDRRVHESAISTLVASWISRIFPILASAMLELGIDKDDSNAGGDCSVGSDLAKMDTTGAHALVARQHLRAD